MPHHPRPLTAFTLIELMIAIMLGMLVVYTAVAGLRVAAQSVTVAQRMSQENAIIRAGVTIALDEKDFWLTNDDPTDTGAQPLRAPPVVESGHTRGLPFTRLRDVNVPEVYPKVVGSGGLTVGSVVFTNPDAQGWEPVKTWKAADPQTWAWGNLIEQAGSDSVQMFGRYNQYTAADTATPYGWQQRQLEGLKNAMGYWGVFDYMPANSPLMVYAGGKISAEWCQSNDTAPFYMANGDGGANYAQDLYRRSKDHNFTFLNPTVATNPISSLRQRTCQKYYTGQGAGASVIGIQALKRDGLNNRTWLPLDRRPLNWPSLDVSTLRIINHGRFVCLNSVRWTSPLTGLTSELNFTAFGTNLRGARQQRHRDEPRWAKLGEDNLDTY